MYFNQPDNTNPLNPHKQNDRDDHAKPTLNPDQTLISIRILVGRIAQALQRIGETETISLARSLLATYLDRTEMQIVKDYDLVLPQPEVAAITDFFENLYQRRTQGEPYAYIFGETEFLGRRFGVNENVLIPRSDSEVLLEEVLALVAQKRSIQVAKSDLVKADGRPPFQSDLTKDQCLLNGAPAQFKLRILELCTGSGCLAISLLLELADIYPDLTVEIIATDISVPALEVAVNNARRYLNPALNKAEVLEIEANYADFDLHGDGRWQLSFRSGDLWQALTSDSQFDIIFANPPYISDQEYQNLSPEVRDFEPRLALTAADSGLFFYKELLAPASKLRLADSGFLAFEHGYAQRQQLVELANCYHWQIVHQRDDYGHLPRVLVLRPQAV